MFTESEAKEFLLKYGIKSPSGAEAETIDSAVSFALEIGFPVVLKISHAEITHKSDVGGVIPNIRSEAELRTAAPKLFSIKPGAKIRVEKEAEEGIVDLIVGMKRDPVFGAVIMLGMGGIYAEILADTAIHVGELNEKAASEMISRLKSKGMIRGARGRQRADEKAIVHTLVALSQIAAAHQEIREMEINPYRVFETGGLALDAVIIEAGGGVKQESPETAGAHSNVHDRVHRLFRPSSVAVVGPSTSSEKAGNIILKNLKTLGYTGKVYPVNPAGGMIEGLNAYPTVKECPQAPELAVLAVPYTQVEKVMHDVASAGTRHAIIASGGFSDAGAEGAEREKQLVAFCRAHDINLMGPNSIGTVDGHSRLCTSIGKLPPVKPSGISTVGQTGTLSTGFLLEEMTKHGRGFSKIACMGNKADVNECDFIEYYAEDADTKVIGVYIEGVKDGARFRRVAELAARRKPVVILKSGRTELGAKAAASHTGAMAGADAVYESVFRQAGLQRVGDFNDFFNALRAFDLCPLPQGNRIGVVSVTGVGCVLSADACGTHGMALAPISNETQRRLKAIVPAWANITNPADIWSCIEQRGPFEAFQKLSEVMIADENVDILLIIGVLLEEGAFDTESCFKPVREAFPEKTIVACYVGGRKDLLESFGAGLEAVGVPVFQGPEEAVKVASYLYARKKIEEAMK